MAVKSLKSYLYCFPETAWFFGIRTDLFYRYCFSISLNMLSLMCYHLLCCLLSPAWYDPYHAITCHATIWHLPLLWYLFALITCLLSC